MEPGEPGRARVTGGLPRPVAPIRILVGTQNHATKTLIVDVLRRDSSLLVTSCASGREVLEVIDSGRPDLVMLDVQIGATDAFAVIETVGSSRMPPVILIAPTRDLAARAFEVRALDYLVQPLNRRRVSQAVSWARELVLRERALAAAGRLLDEAPRRDRYETSGPRIAVRSGNRLVFIDPAEIDWIQAGHNYVRLHVGSKTHRVRKTLAELESELGGHRFARAHRGILVRLDQIRELRLKSGWRCEAVLKTGAAVPVSRKYRTLLQRRLRRG